MNPLLNELSRKLLGKAALADCSLQELEELASRFPAFASLQILLAARKKQMNPDSVSTFSGRASFFLHHPLWAEESWEPKLEMMGGTQPLSLVEEMPAKQGSDTPYQAELETAFTQEELVVQTDSTISELKGLDQEQPLLAPTPHTVTEAERPGEKEPLPVIPGPLPVVAASHSKSAGDLLTFEPYHTVDYFASQGIRYREELKEKDRFSVQLRSFTEWLKTMKRLPASEQVTVASVSEEKKVEQMAEVSIAPREIVTETMAEVWEKQGNREKALQVYQKLSLLDPGKSAYFAAKIDKLKHS